MSPLILKSTAHWSEVLLSVLLDYDPCLSLSCWVRESSSYALCSTSRMDSLNIKPNCLMSPGNSVVNPSWSAVQVCWRLQELIQLSADRGFIMLTGSGWWSITLKPFLKCRNARESPSLSSKDCTRFIHNAKEKDGRLGTRRPGF